ncbi:MAG: DeoR/GlpR family DNA-binding transcription regulator [Brevinema sp.]
MKKIVDKEEILNFIYKHIKISIEDILDNFHISVSTAYRILKQLDDENWIVFDSNTIYYKPATLFSYDCIDTVILTHALAWESAKIIQENDVICLSGGSTTIASILPFIILTKKNITIISNSSLVFQYYLLFYNQAIQNSINLITIGGQLRHHFHSFGGEYADQIIEHFNIAKTFLGTECVHEKQGLLTNTLAESFIETAFMKVSEQTYLVASAQKFYKKAKYVWADWNQFNGIISDYDLSNFRNRKNFQCYQLDKNSW